MPGKEPPTTRPCAICRHPGPHASFAAREMMFGSGAPFVYFECAGCGCLQLRDPPPDPAQFYPAAYYAHRPLKVRRGLALRRFVRRQKWRCALAATGWRARLGARWPLPAKYAWLKQAGVTPDSRILDVGCGVGELLLKLHAHGFTDLTGLDPFLESDLDYRNGVRIHKQSLAEFAGEDDRQRLATVGGGKDKEHLAKFAGAYDLVMLHHSFEHLPDPRAALGDLRRLTVPGGGVLLRVPVAGTYAWRTYGVNWVQLDAPRHCFLYTVRALERLARETGFAVASVVFDSGAFQFWGSEQYARGLPLEGPQRPAAPLFTREELRQSAARAAELNAKADGDQASFYLRKKAGTGD